MQEVTYYYGNWEAGGWLPSSKEVYNWDLEVSREELLLPVTFPLENFNNLLKGMLEQNWKPENEAWWDIGRVVCYYSETAGSGLPATLLLPVRVYPNPVTEWLQVDLGTPGASTIIELYDNQGRQVIRENLVGSGRVSVQSLKPGIYHYRLLVDGRWQTGKVLIPKT
jgi:hypothetical protein